MHNFFFVTNFYVWLHVEGAYIREVFECNIVLYDENIEIRVGI